MKQPTPTVSREDVLRVIRREFPRVAEDKVLAILDQYGTEDWHRVRGRVQLAVLQLGAGKLRALPEHTKIACADYRDVLVPAEYPAYSKHSFSERFKRGEEAKINEGDWNQYQQWLTR